MRSPRAACRSRCSTRPRSSAASRSGSSRARRGLFQADGGIVYADLALQALRGSAEAPVHVRERTRVDSVEEDGDGVVVGGVRARAAVVTAGAWAPALVGVDATPTLETTSYFSLDEPMPSVIDAPGGAAGYALVAPGVGLKAGLHQSGPAVDPDERARPTRRSRSGRRSGWSGGSRRRRARPDGDLPLHEAAERRVPARAARPHRGRIALQRPRLQVRAGGRRSARGARAEDVL